MASIDIEMTGLKAQRHRHADAVILRKVQNFDIF